jgi:hypothetical protein
MFIWTFFLLLVCGTCAQSFSVYFSCTLYRDREPRGPCSLRTEYSRMEQSVCWEYGDINHLRRNCWQGYSQKHFPEENRLSLKKQIVETVKKVLVTTRASSLYTQRIGKAQPWRSACQGTDRSESMSCYYRHWSICDHCQAGHNHWSSQERPTHAVWPAEGIRGVPPHLEGSFNKTDRGSMH